MTVTAIIAEMIAYLFYRLRLMPIESAIGIGLLVIIGWIIDWRRCG